MNSEGNNVLVAQPATRTSPVRLGREQDAGMALFPPGQLASYATKQDLRTKADLVGGKVPVEQLPECANPVESVNGKTGVVTLNAADVGAATTSDATLTEAANAWVFADGLLEAAIVNLEIPDADDAYLEIVSTSLGYDACVISVLGGSQEVCGVEINGTAARMIFGPDWALAVVPDGGTVATRSSATGYQLGYQADKSLAKDAELQAHKADTTAHVTTAEKTAWNGKQNAISDLSTIRSGAASGATAYQKPSGGIQKNDLSTDVQTSLGKADTAAQSATTYTKNEVDAIVQAVKTGSRVVVQSLPASGDPLVIYMVPKSTAQTNNAYDEYIWLSTGAWEKIGDTTIDLSGKADKVANATSGNFAALDSNGNLTDSGAKAGDFATSAQGAKADSAYQKPSDGIPASDIKNGVIPTIPTISTDISADATSDTKTASPKAVKTFVEDKGYITSYTETDPVFAAQRNMLAYTSGTTLAPGTACYRSSLNADGTFPSIDATAIPTAAAYYQFELELSVPSTVPSTITGPSGWTWLDGHGLPDPADLSGGETICISVRLDCTARTFLASVWRVA